MKAATARCAEISADHWWSRSDIQLGESASPTERHYLNGELKGGEQVDEFVECEFVDVGLE